MLRSLVGSEMCIRDSPDTLASLFSAGTCHTIDSALVSAQITNSFEVDAWGTATMPDGNDYDALRVLVEQDYTYTIQIYCSDTLTGTSSGWFAGGGDSDISNEIHFISNHPDIRYSLVTLDMDSAFIEEASFLNGSSLSSVNTIESNIFNVFPVPSSYNITIETDNLTNNRYELFDLSGKLVKENNFYQSAQINLFTLAKGTYLLKIHDEKGYVNKKVIVEEQLAVEVNPGSYVKTFACAYNFEMSTTSGPIDGLYIGRLLEQSHKLTITGIVVAIILSLIHI